MAHDVFISYSSKDKQVADALCARLESNRIRCWIAPRDVLPGVEYAKALSNAIVESRILVLILSANSNGSQMVLREVERAVSKEIPILPFRIENVNLSESMGFYVGTQHWLDALTPPLEKHLQKLSETVRLLLPEEEVTMSSANNETEPQTQGEQTNQSSKAENSEQLIQFNSSFIKSPLVIIAILIALISGMLVYYTNHSATKVVVLNSSTLGPDDTTGSDQETSQIQAGITGQNAPATTQALNNSSTNTASSTISDAQVEKLLESEQLTNQAKSLFESHGDRNEIINLCSQAINLNPANYKAYGIRAAVYRSINQLDKALADANKAIELNPYASLHYLQAGGIYKEMGNNDAAIIDLKKAVELADQNLSAPGAQDYDQQAREMLRHLGVPGY